VAQFHLEKVILFGTYARGTSTPDSDVDVRATARLSDQVRQDMQISNRQPVETRTYS